MAKSYGAEELLRVGSNILQASPSDSSRRWLFSVRLRLRAGALGGSSSSSSMLGPN